MPKIVIEIERPTETSPGAILEGFFTIEDGTVRVTDNAGRTIGSKELGPDDEAAVVARRILRGTRSHRASFYAPIDYPPQGIV
jgi:hypothetical protein